MRTLPPGRREDVTLATELSRLPPFSGARSQRGSHAPPNKVGSLARGTRLREDWGDASDSGAHRTDLEGHHFRLLLLAAQVEHPALQPIADPGGGSRVGGDQDLAR